MANFETVEVKTDVLIMGGGMAACGAAVEAAYWANKNGLKVTLVDKAAMDRSGAVAMGLSAINQYVGVKDGENTINDYCDYVFAHKIILNYKKLHPSLAFQEGKILQIKFYSLRPLCQYTIF